MEVMEFWSLPKNPEGDCPTISLFSSWVIQQDNDPKQLSKSASEWIKKIRVLVCPILKAQT